MWGCTLRSCTHMSSWKSAKTGVSQTIGSPNLACAARTFRVRSCDDFITAAVISGNFGSLSMSPNTRHGALGAIFFPLDPHSRRKHPLLGSFSVTAHSGRANSTMKTTDVVYTETADEPVAGSAMLDFTDTMRVRGAAFKMASTSLPRFSDARFALPLRITFQ